MVKYVVIFYGGWLVECEVSLVFGWVCCKVLEDQGYKVIFIDV